MSSPSQQVVSNPLGELAAAGSVDSIAITDADAGCSTDDGNDLLLPKPTATEVHACQFSSWYYTFRNMEVTSSTDVVRNNNNSIDNSVGNIHIKKRNKLRKNITIESVIIRPLPLDFIQYLLSDGVRLPDCATKVSSCMNDDNNNDDVNNSSEDENNDGEDTDDDDDDEPETKYSFPSLTQQIQSSINQLGNICMPKMNWSSPKDATWINCGSLKCSTPGDVYLLLKSSDFIVFDLEKAWEDLHVEETSEEIYVTNVDNSVVTGVSAAVNQLEHLRIDESSLASVPLSPSHECTTNNKDDSNDNVEEQHKQFRREEFEHELILRKWCNLHPSMEFRCFIYEHELGGYNLCIAFHPSA